MSEPAISRADDFPPRRASMFRFSLKGLLLVMLLAAVFFGGRESLNFQNWAKPTFAGDWELRMSTGHVRKVAITELDDGEFSLVGAGVLSGVYAYRKERLVIVRPGDQRMAGLEWRRDGGQFQLVAEPASTPTGSSYMGAVMTRVID